MIAAVRILAAVLLLHSVLLAGCWNRRELNELAVVVALGVDMDEKGYTVTAQVVNPSEVNTQLSTSGSATVVTYTEKGVSIPDALQRMLGKAPRQLYLAHLRVLVFGEQLARKGLIEILDYVSRSHEIRSDFYMLVAKQSKARDILSVLTPFEKIPADSLFSSIKLSDKRWAATGRITLQHFITVLDRGGSNPVLSGVRVSGELSKGRTNELLKDLRPETLLVREGLAVFKKDKLVGWLGEDDSKTVNYMLNQVNGTVAHVPCPDGTKGNISINIVRSKSRIKAKTDGNGEPAFTAQLDLEANINAIQCDMQMNDPSAMTSIEKELEKLAWHNTLVNIREVQSKYGSDIYGFGEALHRQKPKLWKAYKNDWDRYFRKAPIDVEVKVAIRKVGSIIQPLVKDVKQR